MKVIRGWCSVGSMDAAVRFRLFAIVSSNSSFEMIEQPSARVSLLVIPAVSAC